MSNRNRKKRRRGKGKTGKTQPQQQWPSPCPPVASTGNRIPCQSPENRNGQLSMDLLFPGNEKTGPQIALFNLPRVSTCPGASAPCIKHCYIKRTNRFPQVVPSHEKRYEASLLETFAEEMLVDIRRSKKRMIRIHTSGDFYSQQYITDWENIITQTPDVAYYAYTRSWRTPELLRQLDRLRRLPNMQLWWSADRETGPPPEGFVTYMSEDDSDIPQFDTSLIFRVKQDTVRLTLGGVNVCPLESGRPVLKENGLTCAKCRVCFSNVLSLMAYKAARIDPQQPN
jgi:hypothetical protein